MGLTLALSTSAADSILQPDVRVEKVTGDKFFDANS